jgi:hypothetical protein
MNALGNLANPTRTKRSNRKVSSVVLPGAPQKTPKALSTSNCLVAVGSALCTVGLAFCASPLLEQNKQSNLPRASVNTSSNSNNSSNDYTSDSTNSTTDDVALVNELSREARSLQARQHGFPPTKCQPGTKKQKKQSQALTESAALYTIQHPPLARPKEAFLLRQQCAKNQWQDSIGALQQQGTTMQQHSNNGDERKFLGKYYGNFTKGLPHNEFGEVDPHAYAALLRAVSTGDARDWKRIPLGGNSSSGNSGTPNANPTPTTAALKLVNPLCSFAFDLQGIDSHQLFEASPPALESAQRAIEVVELYWKSLVRDVYFEEYASHTLVAQAISELNQQQQSSNSNSHKAAYLGPTKTLTAQSIFRGFTLGDLVGPYVSQFLLQPFSFGALHTDSKIQTFPANTDYLTKWDEFLQVQNGSLAAVVPLQLDPVRRYIRNGRDLAAYVHVDGLFQAYFNALCYLQTIKAPWKKDLPYQPQHSATFGNQVGFTTFGAPHLQTLVAEVATRALKAQWFQKWCVHRTLRPEEFGGLLHKQLVKIGPQDKYHLHPSVLHSQAVQQSFSKHGSYLLSQAYPEGSPLHGSFASAHATVAGACVTILKCFYDEQFALPSAVIANSDGSALLPYTSTESLTVGNELNKLASNIALGRNMAAVHFRSDAEQGMLLGERVAIEFLKDQKLTFTEKNFQFTCTNFDGTRLII